LQQKSTPFYLVSIGISELESLAVTIDTSKNKMLMLILWCFILANVKIAQSLNYDGNTYNIYPRIDLACSNSSFSLEFSIETSDKKSNQLVLYQDQSGKTKFISLKLTDNNRLVYNDHLNTNKQIPIEIIPKYWYKFSYSRNVLTNNAQLTLSQINNDMEYRWLTTIDVDSDLSDFGLVPNDYTQLFVGGMPDKYNSSQLSDTTVKMLNRFIGQIRNIFYVNFDSTKLSYEYNNDGNSLFQQNKKLFKCTTCEQNNKRQYAVFTTNRLKQLNDKCELDSAKLNLCSKQCTCLTVNNEMFSNYKCECDKQFDYCKMNGKFVFPSIRKYLNLSISNDLK
jgi:hypothetical protein